MQETLTIARRPRQLLRVANLLAAARQAVVNMTGSGFQGQGHASCCKLIMATQIANRRESDRVPMGVECALPWIPVPSSAQPPKAKSSVLRKLVFALLAVALLLGLWQIGRGLYMQAGGPRHAVPADTANRKG